IYKKLETIMHCPICFNMPEASIFLCKNGHPVCDNCYEQVRQNDCPVCKFPFYGTRNFLAEDIIQIIPFLCSDVQNNSVVPLQSSVENKTDSTLPIKEKIIPPRYCSGNFPCQLRSCLKELCAGRMLPHIRYHHSSMLNEVINSGRKYKEVWQLDYENDKSYETAIQISNMGLFFFLAKIDTRGYLRSVVLMLASDEVASDFSYKIKISDTSGCRTLSYKNKVLSCRENPVMDQSDDRCFEACCRDMSKICVNDNNFNCTLVIEILDSYFLLP
ncbi:hypothetical protein L9F63_003588, partial [Diploptera punctata]